ncbi:MAG: proteobacterial dedicated sortase system response regulator [Porticoccaceae bacterium]
MNRHIAIVEDELAIARNYVDALRRQGYSATHYPDRKSAWEAFQQRMPDLAIIDVCLGDEIEGGFDLCRDLRSRAPQLPIIFLTARADEFDVISGLRLGADDYLTKDISQQQMLARIVALFRRVQAMSSNSQDDDQLSRGKLQLNMDRMQASWSGEAVELTVTELWMVHALAKQPGHVKSRQQLMDAANVVLDDNTITSHIKRIRKKFAALDQEFDAIQTAYGLGYRWVMDKT